MKSQALQVLSSTMVIGTSYVCANLAYHGRVSWWLFVMVVVALVAISLAGFDAGWDARGKGRR